jgi:hypothetical protein
MIRKCVFVIALVGFSPFFLNAQQKNSVSQKKTVLTVPKASETGVSEEEELESVDVQAVIMEVTDRLKREKESDPVPVTLTMSYANSFAEFSKYPKIEPITKIYIVWYRNVSESLSKLAEIKLIIETATFNKEEKKLEDLSKVYKESVTRIIYLLEHPQKLSEKK